MARSKSPARAKKTPTKKAPAKKAAAADPLEMISFITNGGTLSKEFGYPLLFLVVAYSMYAIEFLGFQLFDGDFQPSFKLVDDPLKKLYPGSSGNKEAFGFCTGFGVLILCSCMLSYYMANSSDKSITCEYVYSKCVQAFMVMIGCMFVGSTALDGGIIEATQYQVAIILNMVIGFGLQHSMRGNSTAKMGKLDIHKHGKAGYFLLANYLINFVYFLSMIFDSPYGRYCSKEYKPNPADLAVARFFTLMLGFYCGDIQFIFEFGTDAMVSDYVKQLVVRCAATAFWLVQTKDSWNPNEQQTAVALQCALLLYGVYTAYKE